MDDRKCGFVGLIGAPNAGKSTLINALVGTKVSIVTHKAQTTRSRVIGIRMEGAAQIVFVDTPGIFAPKKRFDRAMVAAAWQGASDADIVVMLADAARVDILNETAEIVEKLKERKVRAYLALNKIDLIPKERLLELAQKFSASGAFDEIFMISALKGDGLEKLLASIVRVLPQSPWLYPEDQVTDMPLRLLAAEITREKIFLQLQEELPYSCAVETESWEETDGMLKVGQVIYVTREGHKPIVLGKGGQRIKALGVAARRELEAVVEKKVHLSLFVKVREKWMDDPERYREWGLDFGAGDS